MRLPNHVSESVKKLNPALYGHHVDSVLPTKREQGEIPTLDRDLPAKPSRKKRVAVCVTLITCRHRLLNDDNNIAALKHLRDCIADSFQLDSADPDGDPRIRWQYAQCETRGETGTIVKIERL